MSHAIPTMYAGYRFRSRLEATWAAMFDILDWKWEYEPLDFQGYIPDFSLKFKDPVFVEVKPEMGLANLECHIPKAIESGCPNILVVGATIHECVEYGAASAGLLDHPYCWHGYEPALFRFCPECGIGLLTSTGDFHCLRCGDYQGGYQRGLLSAETIGLFWAAAKNRTQWKPKRVA